MVTDVLAGSPPFPVFNNRLEEPATASVGSANRPLPSVLIGLTLIDIGLELEQIRFVLVLIRINPHFAP
jgi:hypothetical protein